MMACPYCSTEIDADEVDVRIERTLDREPPAHVVVWHTDNDTGAPDFSRDPLHECRRGVAS